MILAGTCIVMTMRLALLLFVHTSANNHRLIRMFRFSLVNGKILSVFKFMITMTRCHTEPTLQSHSKLHFHQICHWNWGSRDRGGNCAILKVVHFDNNTAAAIVRKTSGEALKKTLCIWELQGPQMRLSFPNKRLKSLRGRHEATRCM